MPPLEANGGLGFGDSVEPDPAEVERLLRLLVSRLAIALALINSCHHARRR
jgi:hypothetical protein